MVRKFWRLNVKSINRKSTALMFCFLIFPGEHCGTFTHGAIIYRNDTSVELSNMTTKTAAIGQLVTFTFTTTVYAGDDFRLDFDDGSGILELSDPVSNQVDHVFSTPGMYHVAVVGKNALSVSNNV